MSLKPFAFAEAPKVNIVKGCLCLDCPYFVKGQRAGLWKAKKEVPLLSAPGVNAQTLSTIKPGEATVALGGEIHVTPGELDVVFDQGRYRVGDKVYILQEDAEAGTWKVLHNGKEVFEDLSAMVSEKEPCKKPTSRCWAKVVRSLESVWWVNLQTKERKIGWTKSVDDFDFDRSSCM